MNLRILQKYVLSTYITTVNYGRVLCMYIRVQVSVDMLLRMCVCMYVHTHTCMQKALENETVKVMMDNYCNTS